MQTTLWLSLGLVLGCLTARADIANPLMRYIHPQVAFLGGQDHPDHLFLVYVRDVGHWKIQQFESCVTPILGPEPLWLDFGRTDDKFSVIAVPKAAYEKLSEEQRKALSPESPGVLSCSVAVPRSVLRALQPDPGLASYRVAIANGKLLVEPVNTGDRDPSVVPPFGARRGWWSLAVAVSVAWLGFVVSRRLVRGQS